MAGLVPAIHVVQPHRRAGLQSGSAWEFPTVGKPNRVDGRDKPGYDGEGVA
jgi:hypothetical protein